MTHIAAVPRRPPSARLRRSGLAVMVAAAGTLLLAACGSDTASPITAAGGAASAADTGAGAGEAGGEAPGITFQSARFHYTVAAPGAMTEAADGTASARRGLERLDINVVTGSAAADPKAYAQSDLSKLQPSSAHFQVMSALGQTTMSSHGVLKVVYSWTDGTSAVTGKPNDLVTARYYIARDASTLAVVAYSIAANQYDPQGADDVASTFQWQ